MSLSCKNILIINEYAGSPYHGMVYRQYYLGRHLVNNGYNVQIISGSYSHFFKKLPVVKGTFTFENIDEIVFLWIKVLKYSNAHDKRRVIKWMEFSIKLLFAPVKKTFKPDIIICSPTAPFSFLSAYLLAKIHGAKIIFEVRDIWPLTLVELGGYSRRHPLIMIMKWFEKFALKKSDAIVSVLQNYYDHIADLGIPETKFYHIPNGIFEDDRAAPKIETGEGGLSIRSDGFIVGYAGTFGHANALNYLLESARMVMERGIKDIFFVLIGSGKDRQKLIEYKENNNLDNVYILEPVAKTRVFDIISRFDVCFIGWRNEHIYQYGISANKIFDYMYMKKPILHSFSGSGDPVASAKCGIVVPAEDCAAITEAVIRFYTMSKTELENLGLKAYEYVMQHHTYSRIAQCFIEVFEQTQN